MADMKKNNEIKLIREEIKGKRAGTAATSNTKNNFGADYSKGKRMKYEPNSSSYNQRKINKQLNNNFTNNKPNKRIEFSNTSKDKDSQYNNTHNIHNTHNTHNNNTNLDKKLQQNQEYPNLLEQDCNLFMTQLDGYKDHLDFMSKKIENNDNFLHEDLKVAKKFQFQGDLLNIMKYQAKVEKAQKEDMKDSDYVDIQKLIKYTRNRQSRQKEKQLQNKLKNKRKSIIHNGIGGGLGNINMEVDSLGSENGSFSNEENNSIDNMNMQKNKMPNINPYLSRNTLNPNQNPNTNINNPITNNINMNSNNVQILNTNASNNMNNMHTNNNIQNTKSNLNKKNNNPNPNPNNNKLYSPDINLELLEALQNETKNLNDINTINLVKREVAMTYELGKHFIQ